MKGVIALRRLALLRVVALVVIVMAGLAANLGSPPASAKTAASPPLSEYHANGSNDVTYHGGSVIHNPKVFLIFEGTWAASDMQAVNQYFTDVNGSSFEGILTQYYDSSGHISNTISVTKSVMDPNFFHSDACGNHSILDGGHSPLNSSDYEDIWDEITAEAAPIDGSTIYFVFTPPGYSVIGPTDSCNTPECGYHNNFPYGALYAVIPYGGGPCNSIFPSGADPVLIDINTASHEQFEAITNPFWTLFQQQGGGWYNTTDCGSGNACEIGDKCSDAHFGISPSQAIYPLVQGEYSNATHDCEYPAMPISVEDLSPGGGNFNTLWLQMGGPLGPLGDPIDNWYNIPGGQTQDFVGGSIYWSSATGTDEVQGAIYLKYTSAQGPTGGLGFPVTDQQAIAGGSVSYFYGGLCSTRGPYNSGSGIYYSSATGAHLVEGCNYHEYWNAGGPSALGFPTTDVLGISGGYVSYFYGNLCGGRGPNSSGAAIYYSNATGSHLVGGCIYNKYWNMGASGSLLGYPSSDVLAISGGYVSFFAGQSCNGGGPYSSGSALYYSSSTGAHEVHGCIYAEYQHMGATSGLGFPTSDEYSIYGGAESDFAGAGCGSTGSTIQWSSSTGAHEIQGCIYNHYVYLIRAGLSLGFPVTDEQNVYNSSGGVIGRENLFNGYGCGGTGSAILWSSSTGPHEVHGCIYHAYVNFGGPASGLGLPVSDEYTNPSGQRESDFQGGYIIWWNGQAYITLYSHGCGPVGAGC